ncbi:MAG: DNA replication and repair protein RecF, partial [Treponema sp.]|nr:DNA replication and repair protein RecF [Treponema sp.]
MIFQSLRTVSFRNLVDAETLAAGKDVFLVGENGQGKTNFLEALYFAAYGSSFRGARDGELAREGEKGYAVQATLAPAGSPRGGEAPAAYSRELRVKYEKGKKAVLLDGKQVADRRELLSVVPCIVFCHEDMEFVSGSPERRRWFFDQTLSLCDGLYLDDLRNYRRVLKARNAVLRDCVASQHAAGVLDALDPQLAAYGIKLMGQREKAVRLFSSLFEPLYRGISGIGGVEVRYAPSWRLLGQILGGPSPAFADAGAGDATSAAIAHLAGRREADIAAGLSLSGPHRDRYVFCRGGEEFAGKASTGQRRLLALLLRVAQARRFSETTGKNPVLLLDDVLLEMDGEKRERFLSAMPAYDQAFYTFL